MDLSALRSDYETAGFDVDDLAATWHEQLDRWIADAVDAELDEPNAMVLGTIDGNGLPTGRVVLLRGLDRDGVVFYTNYESEKARALDATHQASATIPWVPLLRQVTMTGTVTRIDPVESDAYFATRPRGSQIGAWTSAQSRPLADRTTLQDRYDEVASRFEGRTIERPPNWGGYRLQPDRIEFWQGRENRLHDRLRFERSGSDWTVGRLWP